MIKQYQGYGCGLYAVANVLNLSNFITEKRLEESKDGNNIGQLSRWLQEDGLNIYIDSLYYNHNGRKVPLKATGYHPNSEDDNIMTLPILMNVQNENSKCHLIAGKIDKEKKLYLYDSMKDDIQITALSKVNKLYDRFFGIHIFISLDNGNYVFLGK